MGEWLLKGAELKEPGAYMQLGRIYEFGVDTIEEDKEEALEWYRKAASLDVDKMAKKAGEEGVERVEYELMSDDEKKLYQMGMRWEYDDDEKEKRDKEEKEKKKRRREKREEEKKKKKK